MIDISGVPGTGKTASVHHVMSRLELDAKERRIEKFDLVEVNGMKVTAPQQAYTQFWKGLTNAKLSPNSALNEIEKHFKRKGNKKPCILILDEVDLLVTKKQNLLYNFFDWPHVSNSRFTVIAIANTMDLPERILTNRISSRMGMIRVNFQPYNHTQLMDIIQLKLEIKGKSKFEKDALEFCARKISAVSGDARRALDVAKRSLEIAASEKTVSINHVDRAIKEMFASINIDVIQNSSFYQKLALVSIVNVLRRLGVADCLYHDMEEQFNQSCKMLNYTPLNSDTLALLASRLNQSRCILMEDDKAVYNRRVRLNVSEEDVKYALREDKVLKRFL